MTQFRPNFAAFDAMAVGPEAKAIMKDIADKAKTIAEGLAEDFRITGDYAHSFEVSEETVELAGHARAASRLTNTSGHAASVEWGNEHAHHAHRVLGKTLDALGSEA